MRDWSNKVRSRPVCVVFLASFFLYQLEVPTITSTWSLLASHSNKACLLETWAKEQLPVQGYVVSHVNFAFTKYVRSSVSCSVKSDDLFRGLVSLKWTVGTKTVEHYTVRWPSNMIINLNLVTRHANISTHHVNMLVRLREVTFLDLAHYPLGYLYLAVIDYLLFS